MPPRSEGRSHVRSHLLLHPGGADASASCCTPACSAICSSSIRVRINLGLVQRDINVLWDLAPHDLSILDFILPEGCTPVAVAAHGADPIGAGQACVAYLTLQLPGGAIAHIHL